jgi:hypothetical protein
MSEAVPSEVAGSRVANSFLGALDAPKRRLVMKNAVRLVTINDFFAKLRTEFRPAIASACSMAPLADLPKLVGFFSYSRADDEGDDGAVSALSERIYRELRGQLGRTTDNFVLWRDKKALVAGEHWKSELKKAVSESMFFIAMVTPSAVKSPFCRFEFESFVERERTLDRDDLVFPILYITVPELEDERKETDPVVSLIAERQYVDWRPIRHGDVNSTAVKRTVEEFCKDIAKKLRKRWTSPDEREAIEAKNRTDIQAKQRADEKERRETAEMRAEGEQVRKEAERAEQKRREKEERDRQAVRKLADKRKPERRGPPIWQLVLLPWKPIETLKQATAMVITGAVCFATLSAVCGLQGILSVQAHLYLGLPVVSELINFFLTLFNTASWQTFIWVPLGAALVFGTCALAIYIKSSKIAASVGFGVLVLLLIYDLPSLSSRTISIVFLCAASLAALAGVRGTLAISRLRA